MGGFKGMPDIGMLPGESIRASVDTLCTDGTGIISCDPRTKCLEMQWGLLAML